MTTTYEPPGAGADSAKPSASPTPPQPIWNPNAACNWSLLFTPAFGAYLHYLNWLTLNEPEKARSAKAWFYGSFGVLGTTLLLAVLNVADLPLRALNLLYLVFWYYRAGRPQVQYVKESYGEDYPRRSFRKPRLIAVGAVAAFLVLSLLLGIVLGVITSLGAQR